MKWTLVSNSASAVHVFNLMEANTVKEVLRYNPLQQSARISCMGEQRLFFIERAGFSNTRFTFKNEYGFAIGKLLIETLHTEGGTIEIEEKKFHYRLHTSPVPELAIYEHDRMQPLLSCSFTKNTAGENILSPANKETIHEYASLLLGLCWYLFNPALNENTIGYTATLSLA